MKTRSIVAMAAVVASFSVHASTRYWTGAAGDGEFFNPANWSTRSSSLTWADTLYFTNSVPIVLSTKTFGSYDRQWPRYVHLRGADVIVKNGNFRLHGKMPIRLLISTLPRGQGS